MHVRFGNRGFRVILALEFHSSWDPRMKPYIYGFETGKDGRYILDVVQIAERLKQACTFLVRAGYEGVRACTIPYSR